MHDYSETQAELASSKMQVERDEARRFAPTLQRPAFARDDEEDEDVVAAMAAPVVDPAPPPVVQASAGPSLQEALDIVTNANTMTPAQRGALRRAAMKTLPLSQCAILGALVALGVVVYAAPRRPNFRGSTTIGLKGESMLNGASSTIDRLVSYVNPRSVGR